MRLWNGCMKVTLKRREITDSIRLNSEEELFEMIRKHNEESLD
ncbi:hypothetical protein ABIE27_003501 [Paenibacillus sp. 4624]|jgi:hypothetical protein